MNNEKNYRAIVSTDWLKKILDCIEIRPGTDYITLCAEMSESIKQVIEIAENCVGSEVKLLSIAEGSDEENYEEPPCDYPGRFD